MSRTISQLIPHQIPAFIRDDYPNFVTFPQYYYKWLESYGMVLASGIITSATATTAVLESGSDTQNAYRGRFICMLNGNGVGQIRRIKSYDASTRTVTLDQVWFSDMVPEARSQYQIVDDWFPGKLLEYSDLDYTPESLVESFRRELGWQIPSGAKADLRLVLKNIKKFYQARGTEDSFRFLFRILFDQSVSLYYPRTDILRYSDGKWVVKQVIRITTDTNITQWVHRRLFGSTSKANALIDDAVSLTVGTHTFVELTVSGVEGTFQPDEQCYVEIPYVPPEGSTAEPRTDLLTGNIYRVCGGITITNQGQDYRIDDTFTVTGGDENASGKVTAVEVNYFEGTAQGGAQHTITLASGESSTQDYFKSSWVSVTRGTGALQTYKITAYDGTTKIATVDGTWNPVPDSTSYYSIMREQGAIKAVAMDELGVNFGTNTTVSFSSITGQNATAEAILSTSPCYPGRWINSDGLLGPTKFLQDGYYYQDFSYVVSTDEAVGDKLGLVKRILHPAGLMMFLEYTNAGFTYFVDPVNGDDQNNGLARNTAWQSTGRADTALLNEGESVGLYNNGRWILWRSAESTSLPSSVIPSGSIRFIDPENGSDSNDGTWITRAWRTTSAADIIPLASGQCVAYKLDDRWVVYRTPDMTVDLNELTVDLVTATTDSF